MSYRTQAILARDVALAARVTACAATQGVVSPNWWVTERMWEFSAQPGWDVAYAKALGSEVSDPGNDESVITDAQILTATKAIISKHPESIGHKPPIAKV